MRLKINTQGQLVAVITRSTQTRGSVKKKGEDHSKEKEG